jgi:soluble lytic murein transglycosylase-like protein
VDHAEGQTLKRETKILLFALVLVLVLTMAMPKVEEMYRRNTAKKVVDQWRSTAEKYAAFWRVDCREILAIICQESSGNPDSVNPADPSRGLMQITPGALQDFNKATNRAYTFQDMFVPWMNVEVGTWYYATRYQRTSDRKKAFAAYNAGLGNIPAGMSYAEKVEKYLVHVKEYYT